MNASERARAERMVHSVFDKKKVRPADPKPPADLKKALDAVQKAWDSAREVAGRHQFAVEWPYRGSRNEGPVATADFGAPLSVAAREEADAKNATLEEKERDLIAEIWDGKHSFDSLNKALKRI